MLASTSTRGGLPKLQTLSASGPAGEFSFNGCEFEHPSRARATPRRINGHALHLPTLPAAVSEKGRSGQGAALLQQGLQRGREARSVGPAEVGPLHARAREKTALALVLNSPAGPPLAGSKQSSHPRKAYS